MDTGGALDATSEQVNPRIDVAPIRTAAAITINTAQNYSSCSNMVRLACLGETSVLRSALGAHEDTFHRSRSTRSFASKHWPIKRV